MTRHANLRPLPRYMADIRSDYDAVREDRFRRRRTGILLSGSSADYHTRNESSYLRLIEYARDADRNSSIVGQMISRAVINTIQQGFECDPQTGDEALDLELWQAFNEWASDPQRCDAAGEFDLLAMTEMVLRALFVDGDVFELLDDASDSVQIIEAHRCRTPQRSRNVILGVRLNPYRRPLAYYFTKSDLDPMTGQPGGMEAFSEVRTAEQRVLHVRDPRRMSQTRGVSCLAPTFTEQGILDDLFLAQLLKAQIASCFAILHERSPEGLSGKPQGLGISSEVETTTDGQTRTVEGIAPGMELWGEPGEKLVGFSPNIPNQEFFQHAKLTLQIIGINLGLPLVLMMMDASETNFSGWRGAMDQARIHFRRNQSLLIRKHLTPIYQWRAVRFARSSRAARKLLEKSPTTYLRHRWQPPSWPSIQPRDDAEADRVNIVNGTTNRRRLNAGRGQDSDDVLAEAVADNKAALLAAIQAAQEIEQETGRAVDPFELLYLRPNEKSAAKAEQPGDQA